MRYQSATFLLAACGVVTAAQSTTTDYELAAPEIIVFHGPELPDRVYLPSWEENHRFLISTSAPPAGVHPDLTHRRSIAVAFYWGPQWRHYARNPTSLRSLDPARARQHGVYYPAENGAEALLVFRHPRARPYRIGPEGVTILRQRGVPVNGDE